MAFTRIICNHMVKHEDPEIVAMLQDMNLHGMDWQGGTDKGTDHKYTETYARLLNPLRDQAINMLEIGVWHGGSAALWCRYLPKAKFMFMDIANNIKPKAEQLIDSNRCTFRFADAYTNDSVEAVRAAFPDGLDFAVDDGPHTLVSMCEFLRLYAPLMKPGGVMVIEDIQDASWFDGLERFAPEGSTCERWNASADTGRWDDIMLIVKI